jgi:hypothetical protein
MILYAHDYYFSSHDEDEKNRNYYMLKLTYQDSCFFSTLLTCFFVFKQLEKMW